MASFFDGQTVYLRNCSRQDGANEQSLHLDVHALAIANIFHGRHVAEELPDVSRAPVVTGAVLLRVASEVGLGKENPAARSGH